MIAGTATGKVLSDVFEAQIKFATSNMFAESALKDFADALDQKEYLKKVESLRKEIKKAKKADKKDALVKELNEVNNNFAGELGQIEKQLSKEKMAKVAEASVKVALNAVLLAKASKDMFEMPANIKKGIDECKKSIDDAKSEGGMAALKAVGDITTSLKAIQGAAKLPGAFVTALKNQKAIFQSFRSLSKLNGHEAPTLEEAQESSKGMDTDEVSKMMGN